MNTLLILILTPEAHIMAKVEDVQINRVKKTHKVKHKQKESKSKRHKTERTGLKQE